MKSKFKSKLIRFLIHFIIFVLFVLGFSAFLEARTQMASVLAAYITQSNAKVPNPAAYKMKTIMEEEQGKKIIEQMSPDIFCAYAIPQKPVYSGEFLSPEVTRSVEEGEPFTVSFYLENTGNVPWFSDSAPCSADMPRMRLGTAKEQDRKSIFFLKPDEFQTGWITESRIRMVEKRVSPGEIATFRFASQAPWQADIYREYFAPVVEGKAWLTGNEMTAHMDITVGDLEFPDRETRLSFLGYSGMASVIDLSAPLEIRIDISDQKMTVKKGDAIVREYNVSTGTFRTPTPTGKFKIMSKQDLRIASKYPHYQMPQFQMFTKWGHGLHALPFLANDRGVFWNEALNHIGQRVSHGCVRLLPDDALDLYSLTAVGDSIVIQN